MSSKVFHFLPDIDPLGGAQNLVVDLCCASPHDFSIVVLSSSKNSHLLNVLQRSNVKILRFSFFSFLNIFYQAIRRRCILHFHLSRPFYFSLLFPFCQKVYTEHHTQNKRRDIILLSLFDRIFVYPTFRKVICISSGCKKVFRTILANHRI